MTTTTSQRVRLNPPPAAVMRMVNPVVRRVVSSRVLGSPIRKVAILQFTARHSGRTLRVPVQLHMIDGVPTAFTSRTWRWNFAGGAPVTVTQHAKVRRGRAVLVHDSPRRLGAALRQALDDGVSPFLGLKVARTHQPTIAELGAVGVSMIQFHFDPAAD